MKLSPFFPPPKSWTSGLEVCSAKLPRTPGELKYTSISDPSLHREGYRLELRPDSFHLTIGSDAALPYAWQHLQQWCESDTILCGRLEDFPDLDHRGFMLDISRCKVPTRESLGEWVRLLAGFRYNELQLYTEHTFAYAEHSTVWQDSSPMDAGDILWLQSLCAEVGIELIPNQNCFGHFERWIKHQSYRKYAEAPDGFITPWGDKRKVGSVLRPDEASHKLVTGLLDELLPLFKSEWVNIGCDETFELGQGFSKERCEQEGSGKVYTDFVRGIMDHVKAAHGKRCQFWGDILLKTPEYLKNLPPDVMALEWGYEADHPFTEDSRRFAESGLDFIICPGTSSWRAFAGRTENMLLNIQRAGQAAMKNGAKGMLLTDWGDNGHLQQSPVSYPALAWCALQAWNSGSATVEVAQAWCDRIAFKGHTGDTACWLAAGRIHDLLQRSSSNCTGIFQLFEKPDLIALELTKEQLITSLAAIEELNQPGNYPREWEQTLRNMRLSLWTGLKVKGEPHKGLKSLLEETRHGHRELWMRRNREGGLAESLRMYTEVSKQINDGENDDRIK